MFFMAPSCSSVDVKWDFTSYTWSDRGFSSLIGPLFILASIADWFASTLLDWFLWDGLCRSK